ncbi:MAG: methylated-DNA--[protein]-cysteine S-methyltransferase [Bacteriovoracaceae bacterium]|nr:methylated-DNA--[protein]-cysteine S-methyltransferase [Bacteriovoracaceae bacterium]
MYSKIYASPIGRIEIIADDEYILSISFIKHKKNSFLQSNKLCEIATKKLNLYFNGKLRQFDLPIRFKGTMFQNKVWKTIYKIPYGETWSYQDVAKKVGDINACRAVGGANNKNPLGIIVPCHRVVGKTGDLVGYAAGLKSKEKLLKLERENLQQFKSRN